jgi:hypothetical protein
MAQPIRRNHAAVRAYSDQLNALWAKVEVDPLDEPKSVALIEHIINNRSAAAQLYEALENQSLGAAC